MEITEVQIREHAFSVATAFQRRTKYMFDLMSVEVGVVEGAKWMQEQQPKWISVKDILPENSGWYLVANPNVQTSFFFIEPDHVGRTNEFIDEGVTHWMLLPEGPKTI